MVFNDKVAACKTHKKIASICVVDVTASKLRGCFSGANCGQTSGLTTVDLSSLSSHLLIPHAALDGIQKKECELLQITGSIVPAPGHSAGAYMVLS